MKSIYHYTDFRIFLADWMRARQQKNPAYSLRTVATRCGVGPSTLARVIAGSRGVGPALREKLISFLALKPREADYFRKLIAFDKAGALTTKRSLFEDILVLQEKSRVTLADQQFRFFDEWYHIALYQLLRTEGLSGNPEELGERLVPPLSGPKVRKALELMEHIGVLTRSSNGTLQPSEQFVTTGGTWQSAAVHRFQVTMAEKGAQALDRFKREERDISTLTMNFSKDAFAKVRTILKETRDKIREVEEQDSGSQRVYQMNFQLFPLTTENKDSET